MRLTRPGANARAVRATSGPASRRPVTAADPTPPPGPPRKRSGRGDPRARVASGRVVLAALCGRNFRGSVVPIKSAPARTYVQRDRARAAAANTERILGAALELFAEQPFDRI